MSNQSKIFSIIALTAVLSLLFTNCGQPVQPEVPAQTSLANGCVTNDLARSLNNPTTIAGVVQLINALPKPLTIDCFISALKTPLSVFAVNNKGSAQPAYDLKNPRIFIIIENKLTLSVVPMGIGYRLLEMSELKNSTQSVKGELAFPIYGDVLNSEPFESILEEGSASSTNCKLCHTNESRIMGYDGPAIISNIVKPNESARVLQGFMQYQAGICDPRQTPNRCNLLKAIYIDGAAVDTAFPE